MFVSVCPCCSFTSTLGCCCSSHERKTIIVIGFLKRISLFRPPVGAVRLPPPPYVLPVPLRGGGEPPALDRRPRPPPAVALPRAVRHRRQAAAPALLRLLRPGGAAGGHGLHRQGEGQGREGGHGQGGGGCSQGGRQVRRRNHWDCE